MVYVLLWNSGVENLFLASAGRVIHSAEVGWILWIMFFPLLGLLGYSLTEASVFQLVQCWDFGCRVKRDEGVDTGQWLSCAFVGVYGERNRRIFQAILSCKHRLILALLRVFNLWIKEGFVSPHFFCIFYLFLVAFKLGTSSWRLSHLSLDGEKKKYDNSGQTLLRGVDG